MKQLQTYEAFQELLAQRQSFLLYLTMPNCAVCHADLPMVTRLVTETGIIAYQVDASQVPMLAGQLGVFTAPCVLVYAVGREVHRQARLINFEQLAIWLQRVIEGKVV